MSMTATALTDYPASSRGRHLRLIKGEADTATLDPDPTPRHPTRGHHATLTVAQAIPLAQLRPFLVGWPAGTRFQLGDPTWITQSPSGANNHVVGHCRHCTQNASIVLANVTYAMHHCYGSPYWLIWPLHSVPVGARRAPRLIRAPR